MTTLQEALLQYPESITSSSQGSRVTLTVKNAASVLNFDVIGNEVKLVTPTTAIDETSEERREINQQLAGRLQVQPRHHSEML